MNKLDRELKKLYDRGSVGVSLTLKPGEIDSDKCSKEVIRYLRAMKKEKTESFKGWKGKGSFAKTSLNDMRKAGMAAGKAICKIK